MKTIFFLSYLLLFLQISSLLLKNKVKNNLEVQQTPTIDQWMKQNLVQNSNGNWYLMLNQNGFKLNYSSNSVPSNKPWGASDTNDVVTIWSGLEINLNTFLVNNGDYTYSASAGHCGHYTSSPGQVPFGTAFDCANNFSQTGTAHIDLTGTNWIIDDSWVIGGWNPAGSATLSNNNQVAVITGGGYCGYIAPQRVTSETAAYTGGPYLKLKLQCRSGDKSVGTDCYAPFTGTTLVNGQQYLIQANYIFDASSRVSDAYSYFLGESKNTANGSDGHLASFVAATADSADAKNTNSIPNNTNVFVANNVNGLQATWSFLSGNEVYWNSLQGCSNSSTATLGQNGSQYSIIVPASNYGCAVIRSYIATDHLQLKADYDGYSNTNIYYFNLYYKYN
jgi:hypothetical protein